MMESLLKTSFFSYMIMTIFLGLLGVSFAIDLIKETRRIENKKAKIALRAVICSVLSLIWGYFLVYLNLYPVSLAYYEYKNDLTETTSGIIDSIELERKDRMYIFIDNTKYTIVHSSQNPYNGVGWSIVEGDTVQIQYGEHSMYIFDICETKDE